MAVPETLPSSSNTRFSFFLTACCRTTLGPPAAHPDYVCLLIARRSISLFFSSSSSWDPLENVTSHGHGWIRSRKSPGKMVPNVNFSGRNADEPPEKIPAGSRSAEVIRRREE